MRHRDHIPFSQSSGITVEEWARRFQKPEVVDGYKETMFSGHSSTVVFEPTTGLTLCTSPVQAQVKNLSVARRGGEVGLKSQPWLRSCKESGRLVFSQECSPWQVNLPQEEGETPQSTWTAQSGFDGLRRGRRRHRVGEGCAKTWGRGECECQLVHVRVKGQRSKESGTSSHHWVLGIQLRYLVCLTELS